MQLINPLHGDTDGKARNQVMTLNYPKKYKCNMSVVKFNKDYFRRGGAYIYYCFVRSWPLSMSSIPVNYDSGSVLKLNVTFRYERYVVENVTKGMIRSGWKGYSDSFDPWLGQYDKFSNPTINNNNNNNTSDDDTTVDSSSLSVDQFDYTQSFDDTSFPNFLSDEFLTGEGGISPFIPFYDQGRNSDTVKENIEKSQYGQFFFPF